MKQNRLMKYILTKNIQKKYGISFVWKKLIIMDTMLKILCEIQKKPQKTMECMCTNEEPFIGLSQNRSDGEEDIKWEKGIYRHAPFPLNMVMRKIIIFLCHCCNLNAWMKQNENKTNSNWCSVIYFLFGRIDKSESICYYYWTADKNIISRFGV